MHISWYPDRSWSSTSEPWILHRSFACFGSLHNDKLFLDVYADNLDRRKYSFIYYKDILNNIYPKYFEDAGFKIVTAGNLYDINFLSRLKLIIQLADFTASTSIGTHTGYCVYLNKPHFLIKQKIKISKDDKTSKIEFRDGKSHQVMESWNKVDGILPNRKVMGKYYVDKLKKNELDENTSKKNVLCSLQKL